MAERLSVKDILAAARMGGPAKLAGDGDAPAASAPQESEASAAPPSVAAPAPSLGRPLTLKEKLAAARVGAAPAPTTSAPAAAAVVASTGAEAGEKTVPAAAAPSIGRPLTLKEKLAAAKSGGTAPSAVSGAPAVAAAPKVVAAKSAAARELPPLSEITDPKDLAEALRQAGAKKDQQVAAATAKPAAKPAGKPKAEAKTVPGKPSRNAALDAGTSRRAVIKFPFVAVGWASFTLGVGALSAMLGRFMFPNVLAEPPSTVKVGTPNDFGREDVSEKYKNEYGFWIVRSERFNGSDQIFALQSICTHLGCPPNWLAGEQKFKCPCHGSGFYISGVNFEGPAPRPLERFKVTIADDGQILVDKSQKYQEEMGQWADPDSFVAAV